MWTPHCSSTKGLPSSAYMKAVVVHGRFPRAVSETFSIDESQCSALPAAAKSYFNLLRRKGHRTSTNLHPEARLNFPPKVWPGGGSSAPFRWCRLARMFPAGRQPGVLRQVPVIRYDWLPVNSGPKGDWGSGCWTPGRLQPIYGVHLKQSGEVVFCRHVLRSGRRWSINLGVSFATLTSVSGSTGQSNVCKLRWVCSVCSSWFSMTESLRKLLTCSTCRGAGHMLLCCYPSDDSGCRRIASAVNKQAIHLPALALAAYWTHRPDSREAKFDGFRDST